MTTPNILTNRQIETVEEVASLYELTNAQRRLVVEKVNERAWTIPSKADFTAYNSAHSICAEMEQTP